MLGNIATNEFMSDMKDSNPNPMHVRTENRSSIDLNHETTTPDKSTDRNLHTQASSRGKTPGH